MQNKEFLNFSEISKSIPFVNILNWLNISYIEKNKELKGDGFIVSIEKNLYFSIEDSSKKGSIINFVAHHKKIDLREAAMLLKTQFLNNKNDYTPKREMPELKLEYHEYLATRQISPSIAKEFEVGYVKQRSIMAGSIAFKICDASAAHIGYVGFKPKDKSWFFPKGFIRPLYNLHKVIDRKGIIVTVDPFDALRIINLNISQVVSLLSSSLTTVQEEELKKFKYIILLHSEPDNIINRLYSSCFIKAPKIYKPLSEMNDKELKLIIES